MEVCQGQVGKYNGMYAKGQVETRTCRDDCVGCGTIVKRILLGFSSFTTPSATSSILSKPEAIELA